MALGPEVKLWDVATGKRRATLNTFLTTTRSTKSIAFSGDGKRLATAGPGKTVEVWDVAVQMAVQAKRDEQVRLVRKVTAAKDEEKSRSTLPQRWPCCR